jgi:hypothetical protein
VPISLLICTILVTKWKKSRCSISITVPEATGRLGQASTQETKLFPDTNCDYIWFCHKWVLGVKST